MKITRRWAILPLLSLLTTSALAQAPVSAPNAAPAPIAPPPVAPKIHVAIGVFECKVSGCWSNLGVSLSDSLMEALASSGKFAVYERKNVPQLLGENMIKGQDAAAQIAPADVLVFGSITGLQRDAAGAQGCFLGVCLGNKESKINASLRIVDAKTSQIIATAKAQGVSNQQSGSIYISGLSLGGKQSEGLTKAANMLLNQAINQLLAKIPANYYR